MKKALSLLLALVMVMGLSVGAMAATITPDGDGSKDVDADYVAGTVTDTGTIYSVTIQWTSFNNLTYTQGDTTYRWDAANSKYVVDGTTESKWSGGSFEVTITNKSNASVTATASYTDTADDSLTTKVEWEDQSVTCESAAKNITNYVGTGAPTTGTISGTVKVTSGTINADTTGVGSITITLS